MYQCSREGIEVASSISRTVVLTALLLLLLMHAMAATSGAPPVFPLAEGTAWTYRGLVKWTDEPNIIRQQTLTWTMTITRTLHYRQYVIAEVKGHPQDLAWFDEKAGPGDYLIVYDGTANYYLLQGNDRKRLLKRVRAAKEDLEDLFWPSDLFLTWSLSAGNSYGSDPEMPVRTDHMYCWALERTSLQAITDVPGIEPAQQQTSYRLAYRTNPDEQVMDFVPNIGLTTFTYVHHGTVAEAHLELIAFKVPK
jgi:hypothetical protein